MQSWSLVQCVSRWILFLSRDLLACGIAYMDMVFHKWAVSIRWRAKSPAKTRTWKAVIRPVFNVRVFAGDFVRDKINTLSLSSTIPCKLFRTLTKRAWKIKSARERLIAALIASLYIHFNNAPGNSRKRALNLLNVNAYHWHHIARRLFHLRLRARKCVHGTPAYRNIARIYRSYRLWLFPTED